MLMLANDYDKEKYRKNIHAKFFVNNKLVELTYHKAGQLMQSPQTYQTKK